LDLATLIEIHGERERKKVRERGRENVRRGREMYSEG